MGDYRRLDDRSHPILQLNCSRKKSHVNKSLAILVLVLTREVTCKHALHQEVTTRLTFKSRPAQCFIQMCCLVMHEKEAQCTDKFELY